MLFLQIENWMYIIGFTAFVIYAITWILKSRKGDYGRILHFAGSKETNIGVTVICALVIVYWIYVILMYTGYFNTVHKLKALVWMLLALYTAIFNWERGVVTTKGYGYVNILGLMNHNSFVEWDNIQNWHITDGGHLVYHFQGKKDTIQDRQILYKTQLDNIRETFKQYANN